MNKAVEKKKSEEVAISDDLLSETGVTGFEAMSAKDMEIPFLQILESGSPQCKKSNDQYISGASEGMIMNTFSKEIYDGDIGIDLIPCFFEKVMLEWRPDRKGLAGIHPIDTPLQNGCDKDDKGRFVLGNGNTLQETGQYYCLHIKPDTTLDKICVSMASTRLKTSRRWNRLMSMREGKKKDGTKFVKPMFSAIYTLTLVGKQDGDNSWWIWEVAEKSDVKDVPTFKVGMDFSIECSKGLVKAQHADNPDDIPF